MIKHSIFCLLAVHEAPETKPACLDAPYDGPVWLSVSKTGCHPPPERRAEMKGRPAGPCLSPCPPPPHIDKGPDFQRWHCKMKHGFGFCFLIEYEDAMKKTLVTAGRRQKQFFLFFFFFFFPFFVRLSKKKPLC